LYETWLIAITLHHSPASHLLGIVTMPEPELHRVRDAAITVVDADPADGTPSDVYEVQVFGVSVLIRRRTQWRDQMHVPYVHVDIEHQADPPRLLLVEVDNRGETEHC
jgi:hypothetical protein